MSLSSIPHFSCSKLAISIYLGAGHKREGRLGSTPASGCGLSRSGTRRSETNIEGADEFGRKILVVTYGRGFGRNELFKKK